MRHYASASRYAKALLEVVIKEANPEHAEQDLAAFVEVFERNEDLRKALLNPAVPIQGKRGVIEQLVARLQPAAPVGKLMLLLADRGRLELLPALLAAYRERLMDHLNVVRAEVVTAVPLGDDRAEQLHQRLTAVTGRTVRMTTRVDPSIIGGLVARVGGTVYDASVATQLDRMRDRLIENV